MNNMKKYSIKNFKVHVTYYIFCIETVKILEI